MRASRVPSALRRARGGLTTLRITEPGVYENLLISGDWIDADLVQIRADNVVLRNCTIRNGRRDALEIYGRNVRIENCSIHHVLAGTFTDQKDAHGITRRPLNLPVRNTEISHVSGDAIQFDPGRLEPWARDNVLIDRCFLWTGPLDAELRRLQTRRTARRKRIRQQDAP